MRSFIEKPFPKVLVLALLSCVLGPARVLAQEAGNLNSITSVNVRGGTVEIVGTKKPNFTPFSLTDPPRLVIDIAEATFSGVKEDITVGNGTITAIRTAGYGSDDSSIARVLIGYAREVETDIQARGNTLVVSVAGGGSAVVAAAPTGTAPQTTPGATAAQAPQDAGDEQQQQERAVTQATQAAQEERKRQDAAAAQAAQAAQEERKRQDAAAAQAAKATEAEARRQAEARAEAERKSQEEARRVAAQQAEQQRLQSERATQAAEKQRQLDEARGGGGAEEERVQAERATQAAEKQRQLDEARAAAEQKKRQAAEEKVRRDAEAQAVAEARQRQKEQERVAAEQKRREEAQARREEAQEAAEEKRRSREEARQARTAQAETPRRQEPEQGSSATVSSRRKTLTLVGFKQEAQSSRIFIRTDEPVRYSVSKGERMVVLELENTRVDANNARTLDTSFFDTAVNTVQTDSGPSQTVRVAIRLKQQVPYQTHQQGNELSIEFPRPARR